MDRWMNEPNFRDEIRRNPEGTVRRMNLELDEDEWAALRNMDWTLPDEELQARANKG
jgi:hypothetical protein